MTKNLINQEIGELTVTESLGYHLYNKKTGKKQEKFKCLCSCGETCERWRGQLTSGQVTLCTKPQNHLLEKPKKDLSENIYGDLTVIKFSHYDRTTTVKQYWLCKCKCGNEKAIISTSLQSGDTKSCGCLERENLKNLSENFKKLNQLPENVAAYNGLHYKYKICAKKRGIDFNLSREESEILFSGDCYYCGQKPNRLSEKNRKMNGNPLVNGIDRKDNNIGYTIENSVTCCKTCNYAKRNLSEKDFIFWIKQLVKNFLSKNITN